MDMDMRFFRDNAHNFQTVFQLEIYIFDLSTIISDISRVSSWRTKCTTVTQEARIYIQSPVCHLSNKNILGKVCVILVKFKSKLCV